MSGVGVVVPVHNGGRYLADALRSVLGQTHPAVAVVVVDDGSTDDSAAVAASFGPDVRLVSQPRRGAGAARNRGVDELSGEYVAFLDADDLWEPDKLERQVAAIRGDETLDVVFGHAIAFLSQDVTEPRLVATALDRPVPAPVASTALIRSEAFRRVGRFATDRAVGEFLDWHLRAREAGLRELMLESVVLRRRVHDANSSFRERRRRGDYAEILKASIDRRRGT
jgi:glycosyltransferase involved in cell wall biosynthesis